MEQRYWITLEPRVGPEVGDIAARAEAVGAYGIVMPQFFAPPWIQLAAAAARTRSVQLASGVAIASVRSPLETAMAALAMDRISGGRFVLGLGTSAKMISEGWFDAPKHQPLAHLRETIQAVRHITRNSHRGLEPFHGKWFRSEFEGWIPTPAPAREHIPIWVATLRRGALRLAAEVADGLMGHPIWGLHYAGGSFARDLAVALEAAGRVRTDFHVNLMLCVAPNPDRETALRDARLTAAFYLAIAQYEPFYEAVGLGDLARRVSKAMAAEGLRGAGRAVPEDVAQALVPCGEPEEVRESVERGWKVADSIAILPTPYGVPPERSAQYMRRIETLFFPSHPG
jgi:alkanesulfonate monooxygenase SsuD/methylene tetrahydromethanopterin reductase-like flavin-dependent oxidoreductase (luciferase family)